MKNLLLIIAMILSFSVDAQKGIRLNKTFLRVYDLQGEKLGKGRIASFSETALNLKTGGKHVIIPANNIGSIKTKHSAGNNLLTGAGIGATTLATLAFISHNPNPDPNVWFSFSSSRSEETVAGAFAGGILGTIIGGLTIPFKNSTSYKINGDPVKWKVFRETVLIN